MGAVGRGGGGGVITARSNYSRIVSKYDLQLVRDGECSCSEKNVFLEKNFLSQGIRPPYGSCATFLFYHILTSSVIYCCTDARQHVIYLSLSREQLCALLVRQYWMFLLR